MFLGRVLVEAGGPVVLGLSDVFSVEIEVMRFRSYTVEVDLYSAWCLLSRSTW